MNGSGWCSWCWSWCPGLDPDGFCVLADRQEIDGRIRRMRGEAPACAVAAAPPAVEAPAEPAPELAAAQPEPRTILHRFQPDFRGWEVWHEGRQVPAGEVHCAAVGDESGPGWVQRIGADTLRGHVEIRPAGAPLAPAVREPALVVQEAAPVVRETVPVVRSEVPEVLRAGRDGWWRWRVWLDGRPLERVLRAVAGQEGEVVLVVPDVKGLVDVNQLRTETRQGRVEIRPAFGRVA